MMDRGTQGVVVGSAATHRIPQGDVSDLPVELGKVGFSFVHIMKSWDEIDVAL